MSLDEAFQELLNYLSGQKDYTIAWEQARHWPEGLLDALLKASLLKQATPATTVECTGCYEHCFMPVHVLPVHNGQPGRAFIACDRRDDMGRVKIPFERLQQWQLSQVQLARWLSLELGFKTKPVGDNSSRVFKLGSLQGKKRLGVLELDFADGVLLKAAGHSLPLFEAIAFDSDLPKVDRNTVLSMVDLQPSPEPSERYQPSIARREARKLDTQAMYKSWQKEYRKLKRTKPNKSDVWYSQQIAKMEIALGRDTETIRKQMIK
jgi:hypothetical protein